MKRLDRFTGWLADRQWAEKIEPETRQGMWRLPAE